MSFDRILFFLLRQPKPRLRWLVVATVQLVARRGSSTEGNKWRTGCGACGNCNPNMKELHFCIIFASGNARQQVPESPRKPSTPDEILANNSNIVQRNEYDARIDFKRSQILIYLRILNPRKMSNLCISFLYSTHDWCTCQERISEVHGIPSPFMAPMAHTVQNGDVDHILLYLLWQGQPLSKDC